MARVISVFAAPLVCLGLLGGIVLGNLRHASAQSADPFHARAKSAIDSIPYLIGNWVGSDQPVPTAAVALLRPNAILSRRYIDQGTSISSEPISADFLIVQCRDSRDMAGHYPPNCYPAAGEKLISSRPFLQPIGALVIHGTEYHFAPADGGVESRCVYDFFVVPGRGIVGTIGEVRDSAADRDRRQYGAAQIQVVLSDRYSHAQRQKAFADLLGGEESLLRTLTQTGKP